MLIAGALVFNYVVTVENIPQTLSALLTGCDLSPIGFLILVNLCCWCSAACSKAPTILLVIVPVLHPDRPGARASTWCISASSWSSTSCSG